MATLVNYVDLQDAIDHVCAIEKLIMTDVAVILNDPKLDTQEAKPFGKYESAVYPKWLNNLPRGTSEQIGTYEEGEIYTVTIELQLGKRTEGYEGDLEQSKYVWIPYTLAYFRTLPVLKCSTMPTVPRGLHAAEISIGQTSVPNNGDIIACSFNLSLHTSASNEERDYD